METKHELACDKLRRMVEWLNYQDENFNDKFQSIADLEKCFDAREKHDLEFADNLYWEDGDTEDEEYLLAVEVNEILGYKYYKTED